MTDLLNDSWREHEAVPTYLYALFASDCPRTIRYIGVTKDCEARLKQHRKASSYGTGVQEWGKELRRRGATIAMLVLEAFPNRSSALEREWRLIERYSRRGMCDLNRTNDRSQAWWLMMRSPSYRRAHGLYIHEEAA